MPDGLRRAKQEARNAGDHTHICSHVTRVEKGNPHTAENRNVTYTQEHTNTQSCFHHFTMEGLALIMLRLTQIIPHVGVPTVCLQIYGPSAWLIHTHTHTHQGGVFFKAQNRLLLGDYAAKNIWVPYSAHKCVFCVTLLNSTCIFIFYSITITICPLFYVTYTLLQW